MQMVLGSSDDLVRLPAISPWTIRRHLLWSQGRELNLLLTGLLLR
ncbi:MAG: hypothetical protein OXC47_06990 [Cyanobacteria bacterium MAG APA_bin_95]|nr:hypothetical protein [Cyanobacteria bacterium MAG APA_bin_95]